MIQILVTTKLAPSAAEPALRAWISDLSAAYGLTPSFGTLARQPLATVAGHTHGVDLTAEMSVIAVPNGSIVEIKSTKPLPAMAEGAVKARLRGLLATALRRAELGR